MCRLAVSTLERFYRAEAKQCRKQASQMLRERDAHADDIRGTEPVGALWVHAEKLMRDTLRRRAKTADSVVEKVTTPFTAWIADAKRKHGALMIQISSLKREIAGNERVVYGNREACKELLATCVRAQSDEAKRKETEKAQQSLSLFGRLTTGLTDLYRGTFDDVARRAELAIADYISRISQANRRMEKYLGSDLPRVCHEYRQLAVTTCANAKTFLTTYYQIVASQQTESPAMAAMLKGLAQMQTGGGLPAMLKKADEEHRKNLAACIKMKRYVYELDVTLEHVKRKIYSKNSAKPRAPSVFNTSLEAIMKIQRENKALTDAQRAQPVPIVLGAITQLICDLGGLDVVGIFRKAAGKSELDALREALEKGFLTGKFDSLGSVCTTPHTPAVVFKRWLRSLEDPVVPNAFFGSAMDLVRQDAGGYRAGSNATEAQKQGMKALIEKLPKVNRAVVEQVASFARAVAEKASVNRMTLSNMALVLGPCVLRNLNPNSEELLAEARASGAFTELLLKTLTPPDTVAESKRVEGGGSASTNQSETAASAEAKTDITTAETKADTVTGGAVAPEKASDE